MRRISNALMALGLAVGFADAMAIFFHLGIAGVPWIVNVALAKLGVVAALGLLGGGAVIERLARREEAKRLASSDAAAGRSVPRIEFGSRGEEITYKWANNALEVGFSYLNGPRIYSDTIDRWSSGAGLTEDERTTVFGDILSFVNERRGKPTVVINTDDAARIQWERLCSANRTMVKAIEYTSNRQNVQLERDMYLEVLRAGKELTIDGREISTEQELDKVLQTRHDG